MFISENLEFANHAIDQEKIDNIGKLINAFSDACDNCSSVMKDSINNNFLMPIKKSLFGDKDYICRKHVQNV